MGKDNSSGVKQAATVFGVIALGWITIESGVKQAATVFGAIALGWITIELAFKPLLDKVRAAIDAGTDPSRDADDDLDLPSSSDGASTR